MKAKNVDRQKNQLFLRLRIMMNSYSPTTEESQKYERRDVGMLGCRNTQAVRALHLK